MSSTPSARAGEEPRPGSGAARVERSDSKSARTRRRILAAAATELARQGYAGTRMSEIARIAQVRVPAIYYYFANRDAIVEEVTSVGVRETREHVTRSLAALGPASPLDRLVVAASAHLEMMLREATFASAAMRTAAQLPPEVRASGLAEERRYGDLWRELFAEAAASGEIDPALDLSGARMLVLGALNWATDWWDPRRGSVEDIRATAERLVRNALTAAPSPG